MVVARRGRPAWLLPALVGVAGLVVGLLLGGFGVAAFSHDHFGPRHGPAAGYDYRYRQLPQGPLKGRFPPRPAKPSATASPQAS